MGMEVFCYPKPLVEGFRCEELVLFGLRLLAQQFLEMEVDLSALVGQHSGARLVPVTARAAAAAARRKYSLNILPVGPSSTAGGSVII